MKQAIIYSTPRFLVVSHGNGLAYALERRGTTQSVFFQGDDAETFRQELAQLTEGVPMLNYDDALGVIWEDYT